MDIEVFGCNSETYNDNDETFLAISVWSALDNLKTQHRSDSIQSQLYKQFKQFKLM